MVRKFVLMHGGSIRGLGLTTVGYADFRRYAHWPFAIRPPSTQTYSPVMKDALSLARKTTTSAISSGRAIRPSGCLRPHSDKVASISLGAARAALARSIGVSTDPGQIATALMLSAA